MSRSRAPLLVFALGLGACGRLGFDARVAPSAGDGSPGGGADGSEEAGSPGASDGGGSDGGAGTSDGGARRDDAGAAGDGGVHDAGSGATRRALALATLPYASSDTLWQRVVASAPAVTRTVLNPDSGAGASADATFQARAQAAQAAGIAVLGYVDTAYAARDLAAVEGEIDDYIAWYGVDGIYLEQTSSSCLDVDYYAQLFAYVRAIDVGLEVVLDPGTDVPECFAAVSDVIVTFQNTFDSYRSYRPSAWMVNYAPGRFWHLVYDAATQDDMRAALDLGRARNAGIMYVTPDALPNPWDTLPGDAYWSEELAYAGP